MLSRHTHRDHTYSVHYPLAGLLLGHWKCQANPTVCPDRGREKEERHWGVGTSRAFCRNGLQRWAGNQSDLSLSQLPCAGDSGYNVIAHHTTGWQDEGGLSIIYGFLAAKYVPTTPTQHLPCTWRWMEHGYVRMSVGASSLRPPTNPHP